MIKTTRRAILGGTLAMPFVANPLHAQTTARVVVIGGGFGGASAARAIRAADPKIIVTLVEANPTYVACPFSNEVIAGTRPIEAQRFTTLGISKTGVRVIQATATGVDPTARKVSLRDDGGLLSPLDYDRLVLSPGIDFDYAALPGYSEAAAERLPHAWKAGPQTLLLRRQLEAMPDGGVVVMSVPANPYRCPPGPYERASLIADYLKTHKPKSKIILLDSKDVFSKQKLFQQAWASLYPGLLEWTSLSDGGKVTSVNADTMTFTTDFGEQKADVGNVIPPQRAGRIAALAGVADKSGWCPIDPNTFESKLQPNIHVIGDAAIAGAMPKSAFAANAQAKVCAIAIVRALTGEPPAEAILLNTCYSLAAPGYGFSVAGVYRPVNGQLTDIEGAGGQSPLDAPASVRALEAGYAEAWYKAITGEAFG